MEEVHTQQANGALANLVTAQERDSKETKDNIYFININPHNIVSQGQNPDFQQLNFYVSSKPFNSNVTSLNPYIYVTLEKYHDLKKERERIYKMGQMLEMKAGDEYWFLLNTYGENHQEYSIRLIDDPRSHLGIESRLSAHWCKTYPLTHKDEFINLSFVIEIRRHGQMPIIYRLDPIIKVGDSNGN